MIYLVGWGLLYFAILIPALTGYRGKVFFALALLFVAAISIFRGAVGTDTSSYEHILLSFMSQEGWSGIEPGFLAMGWMLIKSLGSAEVAVRAISLIFFLLLFVFLVRADKNELFFLMVYILPVFSYQYSMNGLRIGIASAFLLLTVQEIRRRNRFSGVAMTLSALLFHYTMLFSLFFIYLTQRRWLKFSNFLFLIIVAAFTISTFYLNSEYFSYKISIYETMQSPGILSGLSKVLVIFIVISGVFISKIPMGEKIKIIIPGILLAMAFWGLAYFTYAGLRFLDLLSFVLPVAMMGAYSRLGLSFDKPVRVALFFGGLVSAAAVYRGFLLESGQGPTPFLPYHFFHFSL
jgi:hypothetical protein